MAKHYEVRDGSGVSLFGDFRHEHPARVMARRAADGGQRADVVKVAADGHERTLAVYRARTPKEKRAERVEAAKTHRRDQKPHTKGGGPTRHHKPEPPRATLADAVALNGQRLRADESMGYATFLVAERVNWLRRQGLVGGAR